MAIKFPPAALLEAIAWPLVRLDPFQTQFSSLEPALYYQASSPESVPPPGDSVLVMTWNIKFGGGRLDFWFDGHADRVHMTEEEVLINLAGVAEKIRELDPDILLLQEVDLDSKRTRFIDQLQWILDRTDLNFGVYASQWRARFVPAHGLGRVEMGNAILSKYPIRDAQRIALPQMKSQDPLTRYFYLKRHLLLASVELDSQRSLSVVNTHAEAFSKMGTKKEHLDHFKAELDRLDLAGALFVAGGDLNSLPPGSKQRHNFDDVVTHDPAFEASDYRHEADWLTALYQTYEPAIALKDYEQDNRPYFTHSTSGDTSWNRKLDYLFTNAGFVPGSAQTHQDTMALSDHAPITARVRLLPKPGGQG